MVVLDKQYNVIGKKFEDVNPIWKRAHIFFFSVSFISGAITAFAFGSSIFNFGENCILGANISFYEDEYLKIDNETLSINLLDTHWGPNSKCDFCLFSLIVIAIFALILTIFFIINPRGGRGSEHYGISPPWQIVFPSIIFVGITCIILLFVSYHLNNGIEAFCEEFGDVFNKTGCIPEINIYTTLFHEEIKPEYTYLTLTKYVFYAVFISWVCQLLLLIARVILGIDFEVLVTSIKTNNVNDDKGQDTDIEDEIEV